MLDEIRKQARQELAQLFKSYGDNPELLLSELEQLLISWRLTGLNLGEQLGINRHGKT